MTLKSKVKFEYASYLGILQSLKLFHHSTINIAINEDRNSIYYVDKTFRIIRIMNFNRAQN